MRRAVGAEAGGEFVADGQELFLFVVGEVGEGDGDFFLVVVPDQALLSLPGVGDFDDGAAAIGWVGVALDEAFVGQGVDQGGDAAPGDVEGVGELGHGHAAGGAQRGQYAQSGVADGVIGHAGLHPAGPGGPHFTKRRDEGGQPLGACIS